MKKQPKEQQIEVKVKKLRLSNQEQGELMGKKNIRDLFFYIAGLIEKDMNVFVETVIKPAKGLKRETPVRISINDGWIEYDESVRKEKNGKPADKKV